MNYGKVFSKLFIVVIFFVTLISIIIAVFFSLRLFERNLKADIFFYTRDISMKIMRTTGSEFKRYLLLKDIGKTIDSATMEEDLKTQLEDKSDLFGKKGDFKNLVSSIGYYNSTFPERAYEYNFAKNEWILLNDVFKRAQGDTDWNLFFDRSNKIENLFIIEQLKGQGRTLFFRIDLYSFISEYIKEAVEETYPDLVFKWHRLNTADEKNYNKRRNKIEDYTFNPLRIITNQNKNSEPLIVEIPAFFDIKKEIFIKDEKVKFDKKDTPPFLHTGVFVEIYNKKGSYYYSIEKKAAINFLKSVSIIFFIAALFVLLIIQLQRSRRMRYSEKQFVASVTHELRTPLTVISSAADNLDSGIVPPEKINLYSKLIKEQSKRLGSMIEEILEYSRFEGNKNKKGQAEEASLNELMTTMERDFEEVSSSTGLQIKWNTYGLPNKVITHPEAIILVTGNLLTNAINHAYAQNKESVKHNDRKPEIRVGVRLLIPNKLEIIVEDDGRGIETRELKHIFEPFYRDPISRNSQEKGSGLGLFIARQKTIFSSGKLIVNSPYKRLDGSISGGCRFVLVLPCFLPEENKEVKTDD